MMRQAAQQPDEALCGIVFNGQHHGVPRPATAASAPPARGRVVAPICHPATYWMTGNTLHVDGGESIVG